VIAEDLVAREPWVRANIDRFRRALIILGVEDPDQVIAERLSGETPFVSTVDSEEQKEAPASPRREEPIVIEEPETVVIEAAEVDLSDVLGSFDKAAPPVPLEDVFDDMRTKAVRESQLQDAQARYAVAIDHANNGRLDEAIAGFEAAARAPLMRFQAGTRLGRLHVARGDFAKAVEWLERAVQAPAPTAEDAHAAMYDLADALEKLSEHSRALAILLELSSDAGSYRDIESRIDRLSKVQTRG
jgi:tetratricopeptide (TPR) repeat protein